MEKKLLFLIYLFLTAFALNFVWELLQMPLYDVPWEIWSAKCIWICFLATIWDAGYTTFLYLLIAFLNKDFYWVRNLDRRNVFLVLFIGIATAMFVEVRALGLGDWAYGPNMPLLPLGVGLTPGIQLALLSLLGFFILKKLKND